MFFTPICLLGHSFHPQYNVIKNNKYNYFMGLLDTLISSISSENFKNNKAKVNISLLIHEFLRTSFY